MDPITFSIELELGTVLIAVVGAVATWLQNRHHKRQHRQRELHHREMRAIQERHHQERIAVLTESERRREERLV